MRGSISSEVINLGPEMFVSADLKVICYQGANYYKACEAVVDELEGGSTSHCVLWMHHAYEHEDTRGVRRGRVYHTATYDDHVQSIFRNVLLKTGLEHVQVYNAMNALQMAGLQLSIKEE